jgi:hypothetical protein
VGQEQGRRDRDVSRPSLECTLASK